MLHALLAPSPTINYNFVVAVYAFFAALCVLLFALQFVTTSVEGFYVVVAPFVPCLVWSIFVRNRWLRERKEADADVAEKTQESKKDQ
ncbi:hypothetical protein P43SY_004188 [Pythium insidiosum]|uniref:Uncharacterized protein n=1 Tax=Pythium insidiosum TaxID=114742 RepID=A0AAD5LWH4_PYTIN|nr:hypothetical protein P43SY_004188 [Pythium insidiosum]